MTMTLTVVDTDGSLPMQAAVARRLGRERTRLVDVRDRSRSLRLWSWEHDFEAFATSLPPRSSLGTEVFLTGSGDFHHLTAALVARCDVPVTIVHFDNHPDWAWTFPARHCGSWVNAVLAQPNVARVITVGCCSDDIGKPDKNGVNLAALRSGRLRLHPCRQVPMHLGARIGPVPGHDVWGEVLTWRTVGPEGWDTFVADLVMEIATPFVWISLDKDVLPQTEAATNWDQGSLPLLCVERCIAMLADRFYVIGIDVCGDYSPAAHRNPLKIAEALIDQPRDPPADVDVNARTNERILSLLEVVL